MEHKFFVSHKCHPFTAVRLAAVALRFGVLAGSAQTGQYLVAACTNLANPVWIPLATNILNNGTNYFSDAHWTNYQYRFYRATGR